MYLNKSSHHHVLHDVMIAFPCYQYEPNNQKSSIVKKNSLIFLSYVWNRIQENRWDMPNLKTCVNSMSLFVWWQHCNILQCSLWKMAGSRYISSCNTNLSTYLIHKPAGCRKWNNHLHLEFDLLASSTCWHAVTCQKSMCQALPHQFKQMLFTF